MPSLKKKNPQPRFSILAAIRLDQAVRDSIDPASVPVRELEAEAKRLWSEAGPIVPRRGSRS